MFKTRTFVALGVFAVVLLVVLVARSRKDPHLASAPAPGSAPAGAPAAIKAEDIDALEVTAPGKPKVALKKDGGAWKLTAPVADTADAQSVDQALKNLAELQFKDVVAESKDSWEQLQIRDEDAVKVVASKAGKPILDVAIGKSGHVRVGEQPRVWAVGKLNRYLFEREPKLWRKREIFRFEKDQVAQVEVTVGGQKLVAKRVAPPPAAPAPDGGLPPPPEPEHYQLVEGQALVGGPLDESQPTNIVGGLSHLDIVEFADDATAESAGLTAPRALVTVVLTDGSKKTIEVGKEEGEFAFVRVDGRIFKLRKSSADTLARPPMQWRDKQLSKLDLKDVVKVDFVKGSDHVVVERVDDATWKATEPKDFVSEFDTARAQGALSALANLKAQGIAPLQAKDAKAGLAKPTGVVKLWKKGEAAPTLTVTVGALEGKSYYVQASGRPEVFTVPDAAVNRWLKGKAELKKEAPGAGMPGAPPGMMMPPGH
jgi:Domain of unknown function (DUF4340)